MLSRSHRLSKYADDDHTGVWHYVWQSLHPISIWPWPCVKWSTNHDSFQCNGVWPRSAAQWPSMTMTWPHPNMAAQVHLLPCHHDWHHHPSSLIMTLIWPHPNLTNWESLVPNSIKGARNVEKDPFRNFVISPGRFDLMNHDIGQYDQWAMSFTLWAIQRQAWSLSRGDQITL